MTFDSTTLAIIGVMTVMAAVCRLTGFYFMHFIPITPRVQAGLKAIPIAVMIGIMLPPVMRGGIPEAVGLAAALTVTRLGANDLVAILVAIGSVAGLRQIF